MNEKNIKLIKKVAKIFEVNRSVVFNNWLDIVRKEKIIKEDQAKYYEKGFKKLIDDFIKYLKVGDLESYYEENSLIAEEVAYNDISFKDFVRVFHFFEESYAKVLMDNIDDHEKIPALGAVDMLHHETIAIVSEKYFEVKDNTVFALAKLVELRDPDTCYHLERTRDYSMILAKGLELDEEFISQLYKVGPLHDIGKVSTRDGILLKTGKLTEEEFNEVKKHTTIGAETLSSVIDGKNLGRGYYLTAIEIIMSHHERYDGKGYPQGLSKEDIPLCARIFAVADVYDALTSKRPYKEPISHEKAVSIINKESGSHFDPEIVEIFLKKKDDFDKVRKRYQINC